ncbi:MAG TPA: TetR/AcrR family transcriptional regulator [Povalibacter sp.]|uniref:TetR/AcrR family transcriptional regulator n=1 Tax=Povalibacter sp. TaxID=1962978 RepID=UPI002C597822|nr:TetR/AcrR family transcriptional regulator [Povalibacter sp.]HMN46101.1 TetR/AcrR family transcriptional regulator [Povalibacter sp.]
MHKTHRPHLSAAQDARAVRTREALRRALLELLERKALEDISIRDIAAQAEVSYTTFFRHHTTKEALLDEIAAEQMRRFVELGWPNIEASDTRAASVALFTYVDEHRQLWSTLLTGGAASALREELLSSARALAKQKELPGSWLPADLAVVFAVSSTIELLAWWLRQEKPLPIEQIAEIHDRLIVTPSMSQSGKAVGRPAAKRRR